MTRSKVRSGSGFQKHLHCFQPGYPHTRQHPGEPMRRRRQQPTPGRSAESIMRNGSTNLMEELYRL
ncbi:MAG: hypothetical protein CMJ81_20175 [Planctomycetaceae bacterium]|nr:hypothetical protein [Planctomycetaceae bacterium]MBP60212.1 hypothetical protein [Planctomycetaceae bacterium]